VKAFLTLGHSELNPLTFNQVFETGSGDGAEVSKYIGTGFLLDKAETLDSLNHFTVPVVVDIVLSCVLRK